MMALVGANGAKVKQAHPNQSFFNYELTASEHILVVLQIKEQKQCCYKCQSPKCQQKLDIDK